MRVTQLKKVFTRIGMVDACIGIMLKSDCDFMLVAFTKLFSHRNVVTEVELRAETLTATLIQGQDVISTDTNFGKHTRTAEVLSQHWRNANLCCPGTAVLA